MKLFAVWLKEIGVSEVTGWRWEKMGLVNVRRVGRQKFITEEEITKMAGAIATKITTICRDSNGAFRPLALWLRQMGVCQRTGYRWEKDGVIDVIRIRGRKYVTQASIDRTLCPTVCPTFDPNLHPSEGEPLTISIVS